MARKAGFRLNKGTIGKILATPKPEQFAAAEALAGDTPNAIIEEYRTDRAVVAVRVPIADEALHGTLTRAAQRRRRK